MFVFNPFILDRAYKLSLEWRVMSQLVIKGRLDFTLNNDVPNLRGKINTHKWYTNSVFDTSLEIDM